VPARALARRVTVPPQALLLLRDRLASDVHQRLAIT
jgi:hypothetical protein